ncbi:TPM domain-containing protein [Parerythrobacter jejuensis]|nr:TPM domain-containing protein [Parerythrobacter jejuensis]
MIFATCVLVASPLAAQDFPELTGRIVDQAGLLDEKNTTNLTEKLRKLEETTTRQLVVATVNDLEGYDIADYGNRLARHWQLGRGANDNAEKDNGVLLLVAPNERRVRIEVGYGLEGVITDALASHIIQESIAPKFRQGNMRGGIVSGVYQIAKQLELPPEEAQGALEDLASEKLWDDGGLVFVVALVLVIGIWIGLFGGRGKGRGKRVSSWNYTSSSRRSRSSSSRSSSSFRGGGGSFGGGGASGGW